MFGIAGTIDSTFSFPRGFRKTSGISARFGYTFMLPYE